MNDEQQTLDTGIDAADPAKARERADVERWAKRIEEARKFDEEARKQYARDRRYARGDTASEVGANLAGTYIDILESFLYARDPDVDALPAKACEPPSVDAVRAAAEQMVAQDPMMQQQLAMIGQQQAQQWQADTEIAAAQGLPPTPPPGPDQAMDALVQQQFDAIQARYAQRMRDAKASELSYGYSLR